MKPSQTIDQLCWLFIPLVTVLLFTNCNPVKTLSTEKVPEQYDLLEEKPTLSIITVPVDIKIKDLEASVNEAMRGSLYEDFSYTDNGGDNLMLKAVKSRNVKLSLNGNTIKYEVPLKLWFKKNLYVAAAEGEGGDQYCFKIEV